MRLYILVLLTAFYATADDDLTFNIALSAIDNPTAAQLLNPTSFRQYNVHAQCSRIAELAEKFSDATYHLTAAQAARPPYIPKEDLGYRFGYVDGALNNELSRFNHDKTLQQQAYEVYNTVCPSPI